MKVGVSEHGIRGNPILILTISNGAGHTRLGEGIAAAIREVEAETSVVIVDVADYMKTLAKFTHVTAYLWLVQHAPRLWDRIDRFQKKQPHTSPDWFYRRGCERLFSLAQSIKPRAIVATEVGCCELGALLKRDLGLEVPLVGVNGEFDVDRAWIKPEVDLYCVNTRELGVELISQGAPTERVVAWGTPLSPGYSEPRNREAERRAVCDWLDLDAARPLLLIAGGSEGMGQVAETMERLSRLDTVSLQLVVLTGRNEGLKLRCERIARSYPVVAARILGWTEAERVAQLMSAVDLMVSKLGSMFNEAIASGLPIIALKPPPGSERVQYRLLEEWKVGCAVRSMDEVVAKVDSLLAHPERLAEMRSQTRLHFKPGVSQRIARWVCDAALRTEGAFVQASDHYFAASAAV